MTLVRETVLRRREDARGSGQPAVLHLRVYHNADLRGGYHELRGEDARGNARFVYRDASWFTVAGEFDKTLKDLSSEYVVVAPEQTANGRG